MQNRTPHFNYLAVLLIALPLLFSPSRLFPYELEKRVQVSTLKNGLRLLMLERHVSPTVSIYIRYRVGAVDEMDGKTGTAHLLEHMMFKGTRTIGTRDYPREEKILHQIEAVGSQIDREKMKGVQIDQGLVDRLTLQMTALQKIQRRMTISNEVDRLYTENGAVDLNASTSQDLTTYRVSIPSNRIELWARIESDRMVNPVFREFYPERNVVMEERRQRSESDPDGKLLEQYLSTAFTTHPYRRPILGWPSDIQFLDPAYLKRFFRDTHAPNNTVIAIVGDINPVEIIKIIKKYFSRIPPRKLAPSPLKQEPPQYSERRAEVFSPASPKLILGYHKPPPPAFVDYVFDALEAILTEGRTSRLFKSLVEEKRIAEDIQATNGLPGARYANQFVIFASPRFPHTCRDLELAIDAEIDKLMTIPVSDEELAKIKNHIRADFIRGLDSNTDLARLLSYYEALLGNFRYLTRYTDAIDKVTSNDIQHVVQTYLRRDNRTIATLLQRKP